MSIILGMLQTTVQPLPEVRSFECVFVYFVVPHGLAYSQPHAQDMSHQQERMCSLIPCPQTHQNTQLVVSSYGQKNREKQARNALYRFELD